MPRLDVEIGQSMSDALDAHVAISGESKRHVVNRALSEALGLDHSTLFQVSTSGALVEGVNSEAVTVGTLRQHGDFGVGTFEGLDGEMVVLDGEVYRAHDDGRISRPDDAAAVPFATVTSFRPQHRADVQGIDSIDALVAELDGLRKSANLFYAVRLDGRFRRLDLRVACKVDAGVPLGEAVKQQVEFRLDEVDGTIVGFWSPDYSKAIGVAGWHMHVLTDDRERGGHVLGVEAAALSVQLDDIDELHLAVPETPDFLRADLTGDPSAAIDVAERAHQ